MFEMSLVEAGADSRRPWTFSVSLLAQALLLALAGLASLLAGPGLPMHAWTAVLLEPPRPPAPPPARRQPAAPVVAPDRFQSELVQPKAIPDRVAMIVEEAPPVAPTGPGVPGSTGTPGGLQDGVISAIVGATPSVPLPAPPPPVKAPSPPPPPPSVIQVSSAIQEARLLRKVTPAYPPLARQTRTQGVVDLRAVIAEDGSIDRLEAVSGHPLLIPAALDAVRQWRYRPTLLNGKPVRVSTRIEVSFKLS